MSDEKTFSEKLKNIRKEIGWSQVTLCKRTGINHNTYVQWERGVTAPAEYFQGRVLDHLESFRR
jgi:transcriptional regulator with XRE-family HTH domain